MLKFECAKCGGNCHPDQLDLVIGNGGIFYATCEDCGVSQGISCGIETWYEDDGHMYTHNHMGQIIKCD